MSDWDRDYLALARFWADLKSKDPSTKVGAVVVRPDNSVASLAYNGFPKGVLDLPERYEDREQKYPRVVHAEDNALSFCELRPRGCTLYCTLFPCNDCAKTIIQAGISRVVAPRERSTEDRWGWQQDLAAEMFREAGVEISLVDV